LEGLVSVIGHADRKAPLRDYCIGLIACGGRKSVEPMAAVTAPERTAAPNINRCGISSAAVAPERGRGLDYRRHRLSQAGATFGWSCTAILRQLGKQDNCQVAVSLSIANHHASLAVAYRLYLPKEWAEDCYRRRMTQ